MEYYKSILDSRRYVKIPTILPFKLYNPEEDAQNLKFALMGKGNESDVIHILSKRSNPQRLELVRCYTIKYCKDLEEEISALYSSKFRKVLIALLQNPIDFLACEVEKALTTMMTDDELISEILCSRSNEKIQGIVDTYQRIFGKALSTEIETDHHLSSHYKDFLSVMLCAVRTETRDTDEERAKEKALAFHNAVEEGDKNACVNLLNRLLSHESYNQLCLLFDEYRSLSGCAIDETIKGTFSGDLEYAYLVVVRSVTNKHQYYAERLEAALQKSLRRDDHTLIRIFVSRAEIDLEEVKSQYLRIYHKTLYNAIRLETSGPYRDVMLTLLHTP